MILGNILWLWLLAAVVVPIAVHLWNRKSGKPQLLGTFRFLPEQAFAKARRIELHEIPLLIVRILLICFIVLLLTNLLVLKEQPQMESVVITETDSSDPQEQSQDGILQIEIPANEVGHTGWWNIIEQVEADYQPNMIHVTGKFTQDRFKGKRPSFRSDITWEENETETEASSAAWQSGTEIYSALIQRNDSLGIQHSIEQFLEPVILDNSRVVLLKDTLDFKGSLIMIINQEIPEQIQNGLEFSAHYWNAEVEYDAMESQVLCTVISGDQKFALQNHQSADGPVDVVEAAPETGVKISISALNTTSIPNLNLILKTRKSQIPVLWFSDDQSLQVNGNVSDEMAAWFYAGVGHKLIQRSLGIDHFLSPVMPEEQRILRQTQHQSAGTTARESIRIWFLIFLFLTWAAERFLAPRRGM